MYRIIKVINGDNTGQYELQKLEETVYKRPSKNIQRTLYASKEYKECHQHYLTLINPIKDNRIINDQTFATRLLNFLHLTVVTDAASKEERDYIKSVATKLLEYQKRTAKDKEERQYLSRICTK